MIHRNDELRTVRLFGREYQWVWLNDRYELHPLLVAAPIREALFLPHELPWEGAL